MPRILDMPLRLARIRAGIGQKGLAKLIDVHRSTIAAIEEGRTATPDDATISAIEHALQLPPNTLAREIALWRQNRANQVPEFTPVARAVLGASPSHVAAYSSFAAWRARISPSPTSFSSMLGVNRAVVANYERGVRVHGMPEVLQHAILARLGVSVPYLLALVMLPPNEDEEATL